MPLPRNPAGGITTQEGFDFGHADRIEITRDGMFEAGSCGGEIQRLLQIGRSLAQSVDQPALNASPASTRLTIGIMS